MAGGREREGETESGRARVGGREWEDKSDSVVRLPPMIYVAHLTGTAHYMGALI